MRLKNKRLSSGLLALVMAITTIGIGSVQSRAEGTENTLNNVLDLTGIETNVNIINGGDSQLISQMTDATYVIDQSIYNNYNMYEGVSATASTEMQTAKYAFDGNTTTRWESEHGVDPQYLQIDFGNTYSLKNIAIYWEAASAKEYVVEVSTDGSTFETLTEVTSSYSKRTDEITLSDEINVRVVRINCNSRNTVYGDSIYEISFFGSEEQKEFVSVLSNLKVKDYYKYTGKYLIYFTEAEESEGYNVYLDDNTTPLKTVYGSGASISASELEGVAEGEHTLYVANLDKNGNESARAKTTFTLEGSAGTNTEIAQIYIDTRANISTEYHDDDDVTISVIDKNDGLYEEIYDNECNIKIRGNTTAGAPKKPWNIKLSSKQSILGMDKGKKWCILANSFDKSLMRNSLAYDMGLEIGVTYSCQSRYVDVYVNGTYQGNYLITEPVEAKKERVDIDAYDAESNDILLELGTRNEPDVDHFTTSTMGTTFDVNDPEKGDDLTDAEVYAKIDRVKVYLSEFESVLLSQNYDEILEYIDEDTFVNFYIISELFKNVDFNFSSTRFYIKDNRIYAGPLWDFDLSSGNCKTTYYKEYYVDGVSYKGYYCQEMNWYKQLLKNENFYNKVKGRYKELQYIIQNIYSENSETTISINHITNNYGKSFARNYMSTGLLGAGWSLTNDDGYSFSAESGWTTWQQPVEFLRSWLENRNIWLCGEWGIDMESAYEESKPAEPESPTEEPTTEEVTTEEVTTKEAITEEVATAENTTTEVVTTAENITTEEALEENTTMVKNTETTYAKESDVKVDKVKITKAIKKTSKKGYEKKIKITLKKMKSVAKYEIQISKSKKFTKKTIIVKRTIKKSKYTVTSKKFKNKKKLYMRVRAIRVVGGKKYYGKWSKKVKVKM